MFTTSEKKVIKKILTATKGSVKVYNFWFVYDTEGNAISYEGGFELPDTIDFRNDFSLAPGTRHKVIRRTA